MLKDQKIIVIVDDNNSNLIASKEILKSCYAVYPVVSAEKMFDLLEHVIPHMILLDVEMPGMNGYDAARKLKSSEKFADIPIVFLSGQNDSVSELEGLNIGALDYFHKPFVASLLLKRLEIYFSLLDYRKQAIDQEKYIEELLKQK